MEIAASQQRRQRYYGIDPFQQQWAASPYWPAAPVDFWAQSGTGQGFPDTTIGGSEELDASATTGGGGGAEPSWMGNLARLLVFSVLLIALLVASLLLGRTTTWVVENEFTPHEEQHSLAAPVSSGGSIGGSWRPLTASHQMTTRAVAKPGKKENTPYPYRTAAKATKKATSTSEVTLVDITMDELPRVLPKVNKRQQMCGPPLFTLCTAVKHEFYFNASQRACVSLPEQTPAYAAVCNRGTNRFASQEGCANRCANKTGSEDPICHEQVLFTECKKEDVVGPLWFFNGDHCQVWNFPRGRCPVSNASGLFSTSEECRQACHKTGASTVLCAVPGEATCSPKRLKYPYFADKGTTGIGCTAATTRNLQRPLCLVGRNRFYNLQTCKKLCVHRMHV